MISISLIITTYNSPQALKLCIDAVLNQKQLPDEIIIADDGSSEATKNVIDSFVSKAIVPVIHIWQKDKGFRLSRIRNKAICAAKGDYIIQIDGDIIVHPNFIQDHLRFAKEGFFVIGSRVNLKKNFSELIIAAQKIPSVFKLTLQGKDKLNALRILSIADFLKNKYKVSGKNKYYAKGCNMAFWKKDVLTVNGYNENITGWGSEDEELVMRLIKSGLQKHFLKMAGIVYHIWHPTASRAREITNMQIMAETLNSPNYTCVNGIEKIEYGNEKHFASKNLHSQIS